MYTIKDVVKDNKAIFNFYRDGSLWYSVSYGDKKRILLFPVPLEDVGNATFYHMDKAILFMRYIRKYIKENDVRL